MNMANLAATLDESVTTICGHYMNKNKMHTFKVLKDFAANLAIGDYVLVSHEDKIKVAVVDFISPNAVIDATDDDYYEWAFDKVKIEKLESLKQKEYKLVEKMKSHKLEYDKKNALMSIGINA